MSKRHRRQCTNLRSLLHDTIRAWPEEVQESMRTSRTEESGLQEWVIHLFPGKRQNQEKDCSIGEKLNLCGNLQIWATSYSGSSCIIYLGNRVPPWRIKGNSLLEGTDKVIWRSVESTWMNIPSIWYLKGWEPKSLLKLRNLLERTKRTPLSNRFSHVKNISVSSSKTFFYKVISL